MTPTDRFSTFHPNVLRAISHMLSLVTLLITLWLSGTTIVTSLPSPPASPLTPINPLVENSSISVLVLLSKCNVIPYPSSRALSLCLNTGA